MDKLRAWWSAHRPSKRRLVQLYCALLYNANLKGFAEGQIYTGSTKSVCVPGFNCYSCPGAVGACPLGSLQNALAARNPSSLWYVAGTLMLFGLMLGRVICGWLCPLGWLQELIHRIPTPKIRKGPVTRALSWLKYVLLAVLVVAIPVWFRSRAVPMVIPAFCKYFCPAGTFEGAVGLLSNPANGSLFAMLGALFTNKWVILTILTVACIACYRAFCRFFCPLGAIYSLFSRFALTGVRVESDRCVSCGKCVASCPMDVRRVGDHECIHCGKCIDLCPKGAIALKAGRLTLKGPQAADPCASCDRPAARRRVGKPSRIAWGAALAVLLFALAWFNLIEPTLPGGSAAADPGPSAAAAPADEPEALPAASASGEDESAAGEDLSAEGEDLSAQGEDLSAEGEDLSAQGEDLSAAGEDASLPDGDVPGAPADAQPDWSSDAPFGNEPGMQLPDFTAVCMDGSAFILSAHRGQVVFINLWATWCGPCVHEMLYFEQLQAVHPEICVIAIHHSLETEDPAAFVENAGWHIALFARDPGNAVYSLVGGTTMLPQTIVLNPRGEVIYNRVGSVTPESLIALLEQASRP